MFETIENKVCQTDMVIFLFFILGDVILQEMYLSPV